MEVQTQALTLWAKSGDPFHPLLAHMLDTAAVAWAILEREPGRTRKLYATDWNLGEKEALPWVAFLAGLHDLGKASPVFQAAWDEGAKRVWDAGLTWDEELVREQWVAHGVFTELYVKDVLKRHGLPLRLADPLAKGLGAHHGFLAQGEELKTARLHVKSEASTWQEVRDHLALRLAQSLGLNLPLVLPVEDAEAPAILRVMALASFADWIASDPRFFPYGRDPEALEYWQDALELARKALEDLPWPRVSPRGVRRFEELFPFSPNPLQSSVPELLEKTPGDSVLLLVEAPMGLGKTEAALYASHLLRERLDHRGLYVALPTQATANGLFNRIREFLERLSGGERWELQLQHGAALLNPQYAELLERARPMEVYDIELERNPGQESGGVAASTWFSAKKRAMLAGHGVGTLDQALLGVLKVKHHFIRLWGLMNRVVVLDEVHAYDTYTSGLLKSLLLWLRALGSSVILMTATLPKKKREELLSAWGVGGVELPPYPRVAAFSGGGLLGARHVPLEEKTLHLQGAPTEVSQVAEALKEQLPGALGAIVNTVDRAQALYQALGEGERLTLDELLDSFGAGPNQGAWPGLWEIREEKGRWVVGKRLKDGTLVFLLHARFPAEERALREAVTLALFGKHGPRPEKAILVATQVAEQSLDLDFDLLYSDLAPVDLLFQRAGRLHRHTRKRPESHQTPVLLVGGLTDEPEFGRELHWNRVYEDYVLLSTWLALQGRETVKVPADLEGLLEEVYERLPEGFPDSLRDRARKSYQNLIDRLQKDASMAGNLSLAELDRLLSQLDASALASDFRLDDEEENASTQRFLTRLGEPSVSVVPLYRRGEEWFLDADGRRPAKMKGDLGKEDVLALWSRAVRLSRFPIPQTLLGEKPPSAWAKSGLLRGLRPLEVERVFAREDSVLKVVVDEELGVVYVDV